MKYVITIYFLFKYNKNVYNLFKENLFFFIEQININFKTSEVKKQINIA